MDIKSLLNAFFTGLNSHIDRGFASVIKALGGLKDDGTQTSAINHLGTRFEKAMDKLVKKEFDVLVDLGPLENEFSLITAELRKLNAKEAVKVSMGSVEDILKGILSAVRANAPEKIGEKIDAMDVVFKGLKPKDTTRFDDEQLKGLMAALMHGGASMSTNPGVKSATNWEVARLAITAANTEYTYTFPANTVSWTMKLRDQGATLYYSSATGKFPTSGDNTTYMTMLPLGARSQDGVEWAGKKMYVQSDTASQVLEIEVFTL